MMCVCVCEALNWLTEVDKQHNIMMESNDFYVRSLVYGYFISIKDFVEANVMNLRKCAVCSAC